MKYGYNKRQYCIVSQWQSVWVSDMWVMDMWVSEYAGEHCQTLKDNGCKILMLRYSGHSAIKMHNYN